MSAQRPLRADVINNKLCVHYSKISNFAIHSSQLTEKVDVV